MEDKTARVCYASSTASLLWLRRVSREEETARRRGRLPSLSELSSDHVFKLWQGNIRTTAPLYDLREGRGRIRQLEERGRLPALPKRDMQNQGHTGRRLQPYDLPLLPHGLLLHLRQQS